MKFKKFLLLGLLVVGGIAPTTIYADTINNIEQKQNLTFYINNQQINDGMLMQVVNEFWVSASETFTHLGGKVYWQEDEQKMYIELKGKLIVLGVNDPIMWTQTRNITLTSSPQWFGEHLMISTQVLKELGYSVIYEERLHTVYVQESTMSQGINPAGDGSSSTNTNEGNIDTTGWLNDDGIQMFAGLTGLSYNASNDELIFDQMIQANQLTIEDKYWSRQLIIKLTGNAIANLNDGNWIGKLGKLNGVSVLHTNEAVQITLSTDTVCAAEVEIVDGKTIIKLVKPKDKYNKIIVIDPGHGGDDLGTSFQGFSEKDLTLLYGRTLCQKIEQDNDMKVYTTRPEDKFAIETKGELGQQYPTKPMRVQLSNEIEPDLFISVHVNYYVSETASGTETQYYPDDSDRRSKEIATLVQQALIDEFSMKNRGLKDGRNLFVVNATNAPAILIETGFISNDEDRSKLTAVDYPERFANAVYTSIVKYYEQKREQ